MISLVRVASLFSGIGGLDLACEQAFGAEPAWFCESDRSCQEVLARHWPDVPIIRDVRQIEEVVSSVASEIDLIHGGYP